MQCGAERDLKQEDPHSNPSARSELGHVVFKKVYRNDSSAIAETIFLLCGFVMCQAKPGFNTECVTLKKKKSFFFLVFPRLFAIGSGQEQLKFCDKIFPM